ncbi:hypothetical protein BHE74_00059236 [Ensete ventricosum]|nr:hypothetical protein BHE74_00059236 [Ensete ventricosum]
MVKVSAWLAVVLVHKITNDSIKLTNRCWRGNPAVGLPIRCFDGNTLCFNGNTLYFTISSLITLNKLISVGLLQMFTKDMDKDMVVLYAARVSRVKNHDANDACISGMLLDPKEIRMEKMKEVKRPPL